MQPRPLLRHWSYAVMMMDFSAEIPLTWVAISLATMFCCPALVGVQIISDFMILPGTKSLRRKKQTPA